MTTRRKFLTLAASLPVLGMTVRPSLAGTPDIFEANGLAASGYDVVAYFTESDAVVGKEEFSLKWKSAIWQFASAENMAAFEADTATFAPQYGGYCAFAMAKGALFRSVPEAWTIYEGKLFLNQSKIVRALWKRDIPGFIRDADAVWPAILQG